MSDKEYSKWALLDRLYEAKRTYYNEGKTKLTDQEYDALESSIIAIHGADIFRNWTCVGYDEFKHKVIKNNLQHETDKPEQKRELTWSEIGDVIFENLYCPHTPEYIALEDIKKQLGFEEE